jgi:hypothetical protein
MQVVSAMAAHTAALRLLDRNPRPRTSTRSLGGGGGGSGGGGGGGGGDGDSSSLQDLDKLPACVEVLPQSPCLCQRDCLRVSVTEIDLPLGPSAHVYLHLSQSLPCKSHSRAASIFVGHALALYASMRAHSAAVQCTLAPTP